MVIEGLALVLLYRHRGIGIAPRRLVSNLAAGFVLMLTVRLAVGGAGNAVLAFCLLLALFAHVADLAVRWRRG